MISGMLKKDIRKVLSYIGVKIGLLVIAIGAVITIFFKFFM